MRKTHQVTSKDNATKRLIINQIVIEYSNPLPLPSHHRLQFNNSGLTVVLEKTLESPLDSKEIQPVHPNGNQSLVFIGRTDAEVEVPILWPPDVKR